MAEERVERSEENQRPLEPEEEQQFELTSPSGPPTDTPIVAPAGRQVSGQPPPTADPTGQTRSGTAEGEARQVTIDEFGRLDLRVATVREAEPIPGTDRLLRLHIDLGDEQRTIVSGIAHVYAPESLVGRQIVVVANLQPARIRGVESHGMLLAAGGRLEGQPLSLLAPDKPLPAGTRVS